MTNVLRLILVAPFGVVLWAVLTRRPERALPEFSDIEGDG